MSGFRGHRRDGGDPLALEPVTMRELGYRTVDMLVAQREAVPAGPALRRVSPEEMAAQLPDGPDEARDLEALLGELEEHVLPYVSRCDHPRCFAFIPARGTFPAALTDFIASALNIYGGSWMESAGPSRLELMVLEPFKRWIGYPPGVAGILVSGGSAANMTALACVREAAGEDGNEGLGYVSDQAHSSIARAARALGLRADQVRVLPTDSGAPDARRRADRGDRDGPAARPPPAVRGRPGRIDQHGRDRPPRGDCGDLCARTSMSSGRSLCSRIFLVSSLRSPPPRARSSAFLPGRQSSSGGRAAVTST
jgi:aromatic-L-amino-acid/L-tryptophan decarboxylase